MKVAFLFILILLLNCDNNFKSIESNIIGVYQSKKLNFFESFKYSNDKDIYGITINLKENYKYNMKTCGLLVNGNWEIKKDSIYLNVNTIKFANDSINDIRKPEIRKDFFTYKIEKNQLFSKIKGINGFRINKLEKVSQ